MKPFNFFVGMMLFYFASYISPTTINGRFTVMNITSSEFTVLLQINTNTGVDDLGGATIVFSFDTAAISFTSNPVKNVDYVSHNFSDGNYSPATVTRPANNKIWVNIDLPFNNSNNGAVVAGSPEWTDVVTIKFGVADLNSTINLSWLSTSLFWGIYDADNTTLWETGTFEDLLDFPFPVGLSSLIAPKNFELTQNYPNPFNPSTRIKFTIPSVTPSGVEGPMPVTLKVYDILGNEVATLVDEEKEPGIYEVEFSTNSGALNLASGIYIYRIESAGFIDTKKMVLLK